MPWLSAATSSTTEGAYCGQVAVNKSKNDDFITTELEKMANCFPRINLLDDVYRDSNIRRYVLETHSGVILFSREATKYFLHSSSESSSVNCPISGLS